MRTTTLPLLLCFALASAMVAGDARGDAQSDEASRHFRSGVAFYKDADYAAALVEFKHAYELVPKYDVLFNLGQTARELRDYAAALSAFERYLAEGGKKIDAKRRKDVQASIDELRHKVGRLKVEAAVEGAEITIDDVAVGVTPIAAPLVVNVGRRKLSASRSGYVPAQRVVDVAGMAETTVTLELVRLEASAPRPPPEAPKAPVKQGLRMAAWVTVSVTAAAAVATSVMGGLAVSARGGLSDALATYPGDAKAIADAQSRTRAFAVGADVFGAVTLAGAVATTVLFVVAPRAPERASVAVSPSGVVVRGVF